MEPGKTADKIMAAPEHRHVRRSGREDHPQFKAAFKSRPSSCAAATRERTTAPSEAKERGMTSLQDRVALVTGSSRGIGAAIATLFANEGARVVVHGRDTDAVELVRSQIEATGGQVISFIADLTRYREIEAMRPAAPYSSSTAPIWIARRSYGDSRPRSFAMDASLNRAVDDVAGELREQSQRLLLVCTP
jgi:short chain dehydrogenase